MNNPSPDSASALNSLQKRLKWVCKIWSWEKSYWLPTNWGWVRALPHNWWVGGKTGSNINKAALVSNCTDWTLSLYFNLLARVLNSSCSFLQKKTTSPLGHSPVAPSERIALNIAVYCPGPYNILPKSYRYSTLAARYYCVYNKGKCRLSTTPCQSSWTCIPRPSNCRNSFKYQPILMKFEMLNRYP